MIKLRVDDETAIPLSVDSSSSVSMTVSEAFIDRGGSAIQNNKNATPSTSQVVVTPDQGFDGMAKVTVAAMPQGALSPIDIDFDTNTGAFTASASVGTSGYLADTERVSGGYQLSTQAAATITPTTVQRQAVAAHKYTTGAVMVDPIPPEYIIPSGTKSISANGTGIDVKAYEKVDVAVPGITPSGTLAIATNGSHDVTNYATAAVAVPASAVDSGTKAITANGNGQDVVGYAAVNVNVPNSYAAADEGKVVQSGALVSQSSATYTENGTYDTTTKNEVVVNVSGGGGTGFVEGNIVSPSITGSTVSNGVENLSMPPGTGGVNLFFKTPIHLAVGDTLSIKWTITSGSMTWSNLGLIEQWYKNMVWQNKQVYQEQTYTATYEIDVLGLVFEARASAISNIYATCVVKKNGVVVF